MAKRPPAPFVPRGGPSRSPGPVFFAFKDRSRQRRRTGIRSRPRPMPRRSGALFAFRVQNRQRGAFPRRFCKFSRAARQSIRGSPRAAHRGRAPAPRSRSAHAPFCHRRSLLPAAPSCRAPVFPSRYSPLARFFAAPRCGFFPRRIASAPLAFPSFVPAFALPHHVPALHARPFLAALCCPLAHGG